MTTLELLQQAHDAKASLSQLSSEKKKQALLTMAACIIEDQDTIFAANRQDIQAAAGILTPAMIDRLTLTKERLAGMVESMKIIAGQPDPVGRVISKNERPNGLCIEKKSVPFGVIAMIYESRPNVTADAAALAFASGNVCVLRGGKEAFLSSNAIVHAMQKGLRKEGLPTAYISLIQDTSRKSAAELMTAVGLVDLLIPRGGKALIDRCVAEAKVPCIQTGTGICHIYVDEKADIDMAVQIVVNAKASRPSVCNAAEVCLVHKAIAREFLPKLKQAIVDDRLQQKKPPVELRLDPASFAIVSGAPAADDDFDTEFLDYILAVKTVETFEDATAHIAQHSTGHSEAIVTTDSVTANRFVSLVDSAAVYINASTRFTDGGEFGYGGEIGISTQKLHARGPIGLNELTTYKYVITGDGQIR